MCQSPAHRVDAFADGSAPTVGGWGSLPVPALLRTMTDPFAFVVRFKKLDPKAVIPRRATAQAAGMDLCSIEAGIIHPGERKLIKTGLAVAIPAGYEGQVRPRSGLALKNGVTVLNAPGTIDSDYRGEVAVILINHSQQDFFFGAGDRIAQLVVAQVAPLPPVEVESLDETVRGEAGFGSTGR